ncbi:OmpA family protein [Lacibacter luteus]|uniref:OmpA family protein n=1 Tax=Lacibacter luteus TaxID=2508719 RepID=A0A4Q1CFD4_9BACT|nr:OmpA family protein [Lacibacter luteus]RXK58722.1 OmpA family protein [Lacibacter luteus]
MKTGSTAVSILSFLFLLLFAATSATSQTLGDRVKRKVNDRVNRKVDEAIDKGLDKTEEGIKKGTTKKDEKTSDKKSSSAKGDTTTPAGSKAFSDFVPGGKVLFEDKFEKDAEGDFPAKWNTNGSGRISTIDGKDGKWLEVAHGSVVHPVLNKPLPENCTIEFDLFLMKQGERNTPFIQFGFTPVKNILKEDLFYRDKFYTTIWHYSDANEKLIEYGFKDPTGTKNDFPILSYTNKILHVSIAVNKARVRVYLDKTKIIDLPTALTADLRNTFYICNGTVIPASEIGLFVSNLRIASGDVDARSLLVKDLLEKGKASTNEILFDVNKDIIKKESFVIINQIGEALKANPTLKIKIVGHTDADGKPADNLSLSKRRAEAVSSYLINNFGIDEDRISTEGKGATVPVAANTTPEGKAKNRRVEFIKQ